MIMCINTLFFKGNDDATVEYDGAVPFLKPVVGQ